MENFIQRISFSFLYIYHCNILLSKLTFNSFFFNERESRFEKDKETRKWNKILTVFIVFPLLGEKKENTMIILQNLEARRSIVLPEKNRIENDWD